VNYHPFQNERRRHGPFLPRGSADHEGAIMKKRGIGLCVSGTAVIAFLVLGLAAQSQSNPFLGKWKLENAQNTLQISASSLGPDIIELAGSGGGKSYKGTGYLFGKSLIAVIRYQDQNDAAFMTFRFMTEDRNTMHYVSYFALLVSGEQPDKLGQRASGAYKRI
jgi:hypothetical protein